MHTAECDQGATLLGTTGSKLGQLVHRPCVKPEDTTATMSFVLPV